MDTSRNHGGADAEDTDELLYTDLRSSRRDLDLDPEPLRPDHCDLLLDAIDAQLGQLQVQTQKHQDFFKKPDGRHAAPLQWTRSPSEDAGLGRTSQTNDTPLSCLDLIHTPVTEQRSACIAGCRGETKDRSDIRTRNKEDVESRREEVIWRLGRLLGDACKEKTIAASQPPSDSICTEDFVRRFREEMVEVVLPDSNVQQLDKEGDTERTESSDSDTVQSDQKGKSVCTVERSPSPGKSTKEAVTAHCSLSKRTSQRKELDKCPSHRFRAKVSNVSEKTPNGPGDDDRMVVSEDENNRIRCLAGVPVTSFDAVSIASDLDSVCTEHVRRHMHTRPGWRALIRSVTGDDNTDQSDYDSNTQEESEPQFTSVHSSSFGRGRKRSPSVRKALHKKREAYRPVCPLGDDDKDTDKETSLCVGRCWSERTSEKMQMEEMREGLSYLRQKCEAEETTLKMRRTQLRDADLCLSELRQRREHALQELQRLSAETVQMETEKQKLESDLSDRRVERDSISGQVEELQRKRELCLHEVRDLEEERATLSQRTKSLTDGASVQKNGVMLSVLEREELERQLDSAKAALFAEQRRARERLESVQESLEQTREELQRSTEAESSLRSSCARLQGKQTQKKEKIQALEARARELQVEVGERRFRVGTLEKMLTQKELQLLDSQEQREALKAERDGLKAEVQHLKAQHSSAQTEAQELKYKMMLKEDDAKKIRISLEQQREQAKKLHKEASEKVHKAIEEERRRWEEKNRESLERVKSEMQQEKSKGLTLQHQVLELKKKMQELERDSRAQQREQESLLTAICKSLKEEHQAELQRWKNQTAQEGQGTVVRLQQAAHLAEKEAERLRVTLEDRESSYNRVTAQLEQQHRRWALELGAECQHLHLLLEQSGAKQHPVPLPASPTEAEALTSLRALREQVEHFITHLHQELDSQKLNTEQLRKHKERELSIQREQLRKENDQAIDCLKERLIQEHVEELSSLTRAHMNDGGGGGGGGVAASLHQQLKAKDVELRQVQRSMSRWKEQTAARLACKFEEELTNELERKTKIQGKEGKSEKAERGRGEVTPNAKQETQKPVFSPSVHVVDSAASLSPSDMASFRLLRFLQTRVKQLRLENQAYNWNPTPPHAVSVDLSGSYLSTITHGQDGAGIQSNSSIRAFSN